MMRIAVLVAAVVIVALLSPSIARGDEPAPLDEASTSGPPFRFSLGAGGALLITGSRGERWRGMAALDVFPGGPLGHYGGTVAVRSLLLDPFGEVGLITAGVALEAAASRPRLILGLHGDLGLTFGPDGTDDMRPAIGGGIKSHLGIIGPLAIATDLTAHLVLGDTDDLSLVIAAGLMVAGFR